MASANHNGHPDENGKGIASFQYRLPVSSTSSPRNLEVPISIPFNESIPEFVSRLISTFQLPYHVKPDLLKSLNDFIESKTLEFHDKESQEVLEKCNDGKIDIEEIIKIWEKAFKAETLQYVKKEGTSDSELFSSVYHKLVHSGSALETILQVENSYALAVAELISQRDIQLKSLSAWQTEEMCRAVEGVDIYSTEKDVNDLAASHFEDQNLVHGKWNSEVDALKESQRKDYREWLMKLLEEQETASLSHFSPLEPSKDTAPILEESFTIHLGSQLKQMHNIRILSADVFDFCANKLDESGGSEIQPQRLQTSLGLYSNDLCGLVLLSDAHIGSFAGPTKEFCDVSSKSTEFHFEDTEDQLESIRNRVREAVSWRQSFAQPLHSVDTQAKRGSGSKTLQTGDIFITRHSNLSSVHVVFHMVVDDSLRSNDLNSRHPVVLGLRNILKTACCYDVTTLTIPLLLMHEMTEEMTVAWCTRRAELIFKCVKGFMIEMTSWGGSDLKNLQFLVPKGISEEVFSSLASMLPSIFRISNPLVFKASSSASSK